MEIVSGPFGCWTFSNDQTNGPKTASALTPWILLKSWVVIIIFHLPASGSNNNDVLILQIDIVVPSSRVKNLSFKFLFP